MAFRVGQKVVCVNDKGWGPWQANWSFPVAGLTYVIRDIGPSYCADRIGQCVRLEEIQNHSVRDCGEPNFYAFRFRPLVEKKTDTGMAVLREILDRETITDKRPVRAPGSPVTNSQSNGR